MRDGLLLEISLLSGRRGSDYVASQYYILIIRGVSQQFSLFRLSVNAVTYCVVKIV